MTVGVLRLELALGEAESLKDKRRILKSVIERLFNTFRVAVAEVEDQDVWQRAVLGVAMVANDGRHVHRCLDKVLDWLRRERSVVLVNAEKELF